MGQLLIPGAAGAAYLLWINRTGLAIPCPFHLLTGKLCPGCGITRMFVQLSRLNLSAAFNANPFLFVTSPLLFAQLLYAVYMRYHGRRLPRWDNLCLGIYLAALLIFGVVRNLPL